MTNTGTDTNTDADYSGISGIRLLSIQPSSIRWLCPFHIYLPMLIPPACSSSHLHAANPKACTPHCCFLLRTLLLCSRTLKELCSAPAILQSSYLPLQSHTVAARVLRLHPDMGREFGTCFRPRHSGDGDRATAPHVAAKRAATGTPVALGKDSTHREKHERDRPNIWRSGNVLVVRHWCPPTPVPFPRYTNSTLTVSVTHEYYFGIEFYYYNNNEIWGARVRRCQEQGAAGNTHTLPNCRHI